MGATQIFGAMPCLIALIGVTQAAEPVCKPNLAVTNVQLSEMLPPTLERKWTAIVSVDASRCAANSSGYFEIMFSRLKELGPEIEFSQEFVWLPPSVKIGVDFWADEAVEQFRITKVSPCPCSR